MSFQLPVLSGFVDGDRAMSNRFTLLLLPDLVKLLLCQFLDIGSLLNFRLTCKDLKAIVEQASVIKRIPIKITYSKQLQNVLESNVPFNNFILRFQSLDRQTYFSHFTDLYASNIRKLHLAQLSNDGFGKLIILLEKCKQIEDLEIIVFDVSLWSLKRDVVVKVLRNFNSLKNLYIHQFMGSKLSVKQEVETFLEILENSNALISFKIPKMNAYSSKLEYRYRWSSPSPPGNVAGDVARNFAGTNARAHSDDEDSWEPRDVEEAKDPYSEWKNDNEEDLLFHPIITLIQSKRLSNLKQIDIESISFFERKSFENLIRVCSKYSISILNLGSVQLARMRFDSFPLNTEHFRCIESVTASQIHRRFPFRDMTKLKSIHCTIASISQNNHPGLSEDDILEFPILQSLRVQFLYDVKESKDRLLIRKMLKDHPRPSVEKLKLQWSLENPKLETIAVSDITKNFPYVKELHILSWNSLTDENCVQLWDNLLTLEKVVIKDCKNLTNKAFLGRANNVIGDCPFNRLKRLQHLYIRDISGNINEGAIDDCFRFMPLRSFIFTSTVIDEMRPAVYKRVAKSILGKSVEYFVIPRPKVWSILVKRDIMRTGFGFINLKKNLFTS